MFVLKFSIDLGLREKAYFTMNANNKHSKSRHVCIISHDMPVMYDRLEIKNKKHNSGSTVPCVLHNGRRSLKCRWFSQLLTLINLEKD